jgi:hypothetical protein
MTLDLLDKVVLYICKPKAAIFLPVQAVGMLAFCDFSVTS